MVWTHFWDMHSGGGQKLQWSHIYIEAAQDVASRVFKAKFDRQADNITCHCCGEDYSVSEYPSLEEATEYHRGATKHSFRKFMELQDFMLDKDVKIVYKEEIFPEEEVHPLVRQVSYEECY